MKERHGYVTNSSSSSFVIAKKHLTENQIEAIREHISLAKKLKMDTWFEQWKIEENEDFISGYTDMDNFDMFHFLELINVNPRVIIWNEGLPEENSLESENEEEWERMLYEIKDEKLYH